MRLDAWATTTCSIYNTDSEKPGFPLTKSCITATFDPPPHKTNTAPICTFLPHFNGC